MLTFLDYAKAMAFAITATFFCALGSVAILTAIAFIVGETIEHFSR